MILNKSRYVAEALKSKGLINEESVDKVLEILEDESQLSREYRLKRRILEILSSYSNEITVENVEEIYKLVTSKFREDVELTKEDIKGQIMSYLKKRDSPKDELSNLVGLYFRLPVCRIIF